MAHKTGLAVPRSFFSIEEATRGEPFSPSRVTPFLRDATYLELSRLVRLGWLLRLSRGRYATVDPLVRLTPSAEENLRPFRSRCFYPILHRAVGSVLRAYSDRLKGILLYGSTARGTSGSESDIDLLVVVAYRAASAFEEARQQRPVSEAVGSLVREEWTEAEHLHPVHVLQAEETAFSHPGTLMLDVSVDGVVLFDPYGMVRRDLRSLRRLTREHGARRERTAGSMYWDLGSLAEVMA